MTIPPYLIMSFLAACLVVFTLLAAGLLTLSRGKPLTIFVVTLVKNTSETRAVGWYPEFAYAHEAVLSDLSEGNYYDHVVIEEVQASVHGEVVQAYWYALQEGTWQSIAVPSWAQNIVNWGLG